VAGPFARTLVRIVERRSAKEGTVSAQTRPVVMRGLEPRTVFWGIDGEKRRGVRPHYGPFFKQLSPVYDVVCMSCRVERETLLCLPTAYV
jgi:hypothetical protein